MSSKGLGYGSKSRTWEEGRKMSSYTSAAEIAPDRGPTHQLQPDSQRVTGTLSVKPYFRCYQW